ncbi:MAG: hypothetical protein RL490_371 [Pseudomonadota bacterium]
MPMDTNQNPIHPARQPYYREDGWTPDIQEAFIVALIEHGSVQVAANNVGRHVTSAYRLRARDTKFATAWDAARRMAYARLRDEALDRAINGTPQEVWKGDEWVGMKRVRNDRLLIAMLEHLKTEYPRVPAGRSLVDEAEDKRGSEMGALLEQLTLPPPPPPPPPPVRLRPARGRSVPGGDAALHGTPPTP